MEAIQKSDINKIMEKLAKLQADVDYLKENMIEGEDIAAEDRRDFEAYEREKREGRLISEEQLKKELEL
jgi:proline dehydrogenase